VAHTRQDGWINVGIAGIFAVIGCYLMVSLAFLFKGKSFHEYSCLLLSKPLGKLLCLILAFRAVTIAVFELRIFIEIIQSVLLPRTPLWLIGAVIIGLSGLAVYHGYETKGRVAEILAYIVFVPLFLLLIPGIIKTDYTNIMPVLSNPSDKFLTGAFESGYAFAGLELLLIAATFVAMPGVAARRRIVGAVALMGVLLTVLTALVIARFGYRGVTAHEWPLLETLFTIEIPGEFMERQNAVVISFWILTVFMGVAAGLFFGSVLLRDTAGRGKRRVYMLVLIPIILFLSLLPDTASDAMEISRILYRYTWPILALLLPFVLLVIAHIRRMHNAKEAN